MQSAVDSLSSLARSDGLFYSRKKHHESDPDHKKVKQNNHELLFLAANLVLQFIQQVICQFVEVRLKVGVPVN